MCSPSGCLYRNRCLPGRITWSLDTSCTSECAPARGYTIATRIRRSAHKRGTHRWRGCRSTSAGSHGVLMGTRMHESSCIIVYSISEEGRQTEAYPLLALDCSELPGQFTCINGMSCASSASIKEVCIRVLIHMERQDLVAEEFGTDITLMLCGRAGAYLHRHGAVLH